MEGRNRRGRRSRQKQGDYINGKVIAVVDKEVKLVSVMARGRKRMDEEAAKRARGHSY